MPPRPNAEALYRALAKFGAPTEQVSARDRESKGITCQIGVAPRRSDIITTVSGLEIDEVYPTAIVADYAGINVRVPSANDLIKNKKASGRPKDLLDAAELEKRMQRDS